MVTVMLAIVSATLLVANASAQVSAPGVQIDCNNKQPELNVHPIEGGPVQITCTVSNPSSFQEDISIEKEWDGVEVEMTLGEDSFSLAAGEEEDFKVTFSGQSRLPSDISEPWTLTATVTNVQQLSWPEALGTNASVSGDLNVAMFSMVSVEVDGTVTREVSSSSSQTISVTVDNNGNDDDRVKVTFANERALTDLGFSFDGGSLRTVDIPLGGSKKVEFTVLTPKEIGESQRVEVIFNIQSTQDTNAEAIETSMYFQLQADQQSSSLGSGLEEVSKDDLKLYGGVAGGIIFVLIVFVGLAKTLRNRANAVPAHLPTVQLPDDDDDDDFSSTFDEFDFSDFDDLQPSSSGNEIDDMFADL